MLTVNIKHGDYTESLFEAASVHAVWNEEGMQNIDVIDEKGCRNTYKEGTAFVMNESGKTIAKYELKSNPPAAEAV